MRKIELKKGDLTLKESEVIGFLESKPIGCSAKPDVPKRFMGHRAYVIITNARVQR